MAQLEELRYRERAMRGRKKILDRRSRPAPVGAEVLLAEVTARIDDLVAAADGTATAVRRRIDETRADLGESPYDILVGELASGLAERVEAMREEARELRRVLERAGVALGTTAHPSGKPAEPDPSGEDPATRADGEAAEGPSQGLLMLATQMAVAGSDRNEIAERLRKDFGVVDTDEVLSRALGSTGR